MSTPNGTPTSLSDELGEPIDGEPMIDKHTGKKILRPRNAWILYRNSRLDDVPSLPDGSRQPMADASKIISSWWKSETADMKYKFELEAEREKEEHKRKYPNYRFQPMSKAQKAQKKAESRERAKQAQQLKRKTKTRKATPPLPYTSSTHTSYLAAAVANQAQQLAQPLAVATYGAEGPSPPMSLASTPATTPSPFPSSDFEQGSSTSATSVHTTSSPSNALGLGLPSKLNFGGQEEASARVPRRAPTRLPPRQKAPKVRSGTPISSRVTSSSSSIARALSPATGTPTALSPLPWPLPSQDAHEQPPPPHYSTNSASGAIDPSTAAPSRPWYPDQIYDNAAPDSTTVDLDFTIPDSYSEEFFNNLAAGGDPIAPQGTGIFSMAMDDWHGPPPDQFDVSLNSSDASTPITPEDSRQFNSFLLDLLINDNNSLANPSPSTAAPLPAPQMLHIPEVTDNHDEWQNWVVNPETSQEEIPTSALHGNDLPVFAHADVDMSITQGHTPPADYYEPHSNLQHESTQADRQSTPAPQQQQSPVDDALPAHLAADPTFLHYYNQYLAHKQGTQLLESTRQPSQFLASHPQQQHSEPQHPPQDQLQYGSSTGSQPAPRQPSYIVHPPQISIAVPLSPAHSGGSLDSPHSSSYSPPSGAATTVGIRRVAAMWKRPVSPSKQEAVPHWGRVVSS